MRKFLEMLEIFRKWYVTFYGGAAVYVLLLVALSIIMVASKAISYIMMKIIEAYS